MQKQQKLTKTCTETPSLKAQREVGSRWQGAAEQLSFYISSEWILTENWAQKRKECGFSYPNEQTKNRTHKVNQQVLDCSAACNEHQGPLLAVVSFLGSYSALPRSFLPLWNETRFLFLFLFSSGPFPSLFFSFLLFFFKIFLIILRISFILCVWCVSFYSSDDVIMNARETSAFWWCSGDKIASSFAFQLSVCDREVDID